MAVYVVQWVRDHSARLLLWLVSAGVFILTVMSLIAGFDALSSNAFFIYSKFAWEQWFPSFFVIMVMLMLLSLLAMMLVFFAALISWKESRHLVRAFYISSFLLGLIMLSMALFCWLYNDRAKPYVIRAGNLLCQDPKVWHCATSRRLDDMPNMSWSDDRADVLLEELDTPGVGHGLRTQGRRLNPAAASLAFVKSLNAELDHRTREPKGCETIKQVCKKPAGFNWRTACVCSGNWDYAPVTTTTTTLPGAVATATVITAPPDAADVAAAEAAQTTAVSTSPAAITLAPSEVAPSETAGPGAPPTAVTAKPQATTPAAPSPSPTTSKAAAEAAVANPFAAEGRLLQSVATPGPSASAESQREDIGPWYGSLGAFCGNWGDDQYVHGAWCFVLPTQECAPNDRSPYVSTQGYPMIRSTAPCSDKVESRSEIVLQGHGEMIQPLLLTALLGGALLALAGAGKMLQLYPSQDTSVSYEAMPIAKARERVPVEFMPEEEPRPMPAPPKDRAPRRDDFTVQRFQEAQAKAMERLTENTPYDLRLLLYGFYNQATSGDLEGERPSYFQQKDRAKYDAWAKCRGMPYQQAVEKYCEVVNLL